MPKVFLSFATEDLDFVTKFFARLKKLEIDVWDYSNRDEEIELGAKIKESLANRILCSDYFIPIVSKSSVALGKSCIQYEVKFAVQKNKKCLPIVIFQQKPSNWNGAFELINDRKYLEMDHDDDMNFEEKICVLCGYLNVIYHPDTTDHTRLPLYKNLQKEIKSKFNEISVLGERYLYEKLMIIVNQFNLSYSLGQWKKSLDLINYFLAFSEYEIKKVIFYYPFIVKGACELQLNLVEDAEITFTKTITYVNADENAFGGMGQVYFRQNKFDKALTQYKIALSKCPLGNESEILYNILLTAIEILDNVESVESKDLVFEANYIINSSDYIARLVSNEFLTGKDGVRIKYLIGLAFLKTKKYEEAYRYFINIYENEIFDLQTVFFKKELVY